MGLYRCSSGNNNGKDWTDTYGFVVVNAGVNERQLGSCANLFYNNQEIASQKVIIGNNVATTYAMLYNCRNFNGEIVFDNTSNLMSCSYMLYNCQNFNHVINIPDSVKNCQSLFSSCINFNQNIKLPNNLIFAGGMFSSTKYNYAINLCNSNIENAASMLTNCQKFNSEINMYNAKNLRILSWMVSNCNEFNKNINIYGVANGDINCYSMLSNCQNFNSTISITRYLNNGKLISNITTCDYILSGCVNFNQPSYWDGREEKPISMYCAFRNCHSLNSNVVVNYTTNCDSMLENCRNFNSNVSITFIRAVNSNCKYLFRNCTNFNQKPQFTFNSYVDFNGVGGINYTSAFANCSSLNTEINIEYPISCNFLFDNCVNFNSNVYFSGEGSSVNINTFNSSFCNVFNNCFNFNKDIRLFGSVQNLFGYSAPGKSKFNSNVHVTNPSNCCGMLYSCNNYVYGNVTMYRWDTNNEIASIPINLSFAMSSCTRFNGKFIYNHTKSNQNIADVFVNWRYAFYNCKNWFTFDLAFGSAEPFLNADCSSTFYNSNVNMNVGAYGTQRQFTMVNVLDASSMFERCNILGNLVFDIQQENCDVSRMFLQSSNTFVKRVFYNYDNNSKIAGMFLAGLVWDSSTEYNYGNATVTWRIKKLTNTYYNFEWHRRLYQY